VIPVDRVSPGALAGAAEADRDTAGRRSWSNTAADRTAQLAQAVAWGDRPPPSPKTIALIAWHPLAKGALRAFATVQLPLGLRLIDCPVLVSNGKPWVSLPAKPVLDRDGNHKTDPNGKPAYAPVAEWRSRELRDRFSEVVIAAIRRMYPEALGASGS
jgi:hypothetical protein